MFSLLWILFLTPPSLALETNGFNQGWIFNRYGSQWVSGFDENEFRRVMRLTHEAGGNTLRLWLFEGYSSESLIWENGRAQRLNPVFVGNLRRVMAIAREEKIGLNLTLFDGNIGNWQPPSIESRNWWWDLLNARNGARQDFIQGIFLPLLETLSDPSLAGAVTQLDLVNEINALTRRASEVKFTDHWHGANRMLCEFYGAKQATGSRIPFTASVGWGDAADRILENNPWPACVDFFDFHVYSDGGDIPRCHELAGHGRRFGKKIQLGEFGQSLGLSLDWLQAQSARNFALNALACGLDGALAWRLAEPESGAYLSFEHGGRLRPAYYELQRLWK